MSVSGLDVQIPHEIVTERLVLRQLREADAKGVIEAIDESRPELDVWMGWSVGMRRPDDARKLARDAARAWESKADFLLGIFERDGERYLGGTGFHRPNWQVPSLEIGYWMRTSETGKGYVREAVTALTRTGFGQLGLRRLEIRCDATNVRSRRVAEAVGYLFEGRLRNENRTPGGDLRDTLVFSLIDSDDVVRRLIATGAAHG